MPFFLAADTNISNSVFNVGGGNPQKINYLANNQHFGLFLEKSDLISNQNIAIAVNEEVIEKNNWKNHKIWYLKCFV